MSRLRHALIPLVAVALTATPALAAPEITAAAAPEPMNTTISKPDPFPYLLLAPLGLSAGYLYAGRLDRAIGVPLGVYTLVVVGGGIGLVQAWEQSDVLKKPVESLFGFVGLPIAGAAIAFGASTAVVLVDQAFLPHLGGPLVAPALTATTVLGLVLVGTPWEMFRLP